MLEGGMLPHSIEGYNNSVAYTQLAFNMEYMETTGTM
jgi:hypothetical protein